MTENETEGDPDWEAQLPLSLTPSALIHTLLWSADAVHTGWESCIEHDLVLSEINAIDELSDNHCRLVEQEYLDDEQAEITWHDWAVELKIGNVFVAGHWRAQADTNLADWDWCVGEAEKAFTSACVLVGKRVRRGLAVDAPTGMHRVGRTHH